MKKKYYALEELLPALVKSFHEFAMFDVLEKDDVISILPLKEEVGDDLLEQTNRLLRDFLTNDEFENHYAAGSFTHKLENPVFFWKDYINCFYNLELIDDEVENEQFLDSAFGIYRITQVLFITEVNKRLSKRRLNGIRLEYKVNSSALDRKNHWERTYDKDF